MAPIGIVGCPSGVPDRGLQHRAHQISGSALESRRECCYRASIRVRRGGSAAKILEVLPDPNIPSIG
jgi:hypothetical protein